MEGTPTHEQAQLHLQVYDLRREARLRQARDWFDQNYIVNSIDDAMRIAAPGTEAASFAAMNDFRYRLPSCLLACEPAKGDGSLKL
jgi:hypothetical protein